MSRITAWIVGITVALALAPGLAFANEAPEDSALSDSFEVSQGAQMEDAQSSSGSAIEPAPLAVEPVSESDPAPNPVPDPVSDLDPTTESGSASDPDPNPAPEPVSAPDPSPNPSPAPEPDPVIGGNETPTNDIDDASARGAEGQEIGTPSADDSDNKPAVSTGSNAPNEADAPTTNAAEHSDSPSKTQDNLIADAKDESKKISTSKERAAAPATAVKAAASVKPSTAAAKSGKTNASPGATVAKPAASDRTAAAGYYLADGTVFLISSALAAKGKLVLDVARGSYKAGANVQIYKGNTTRAQYWRAVYKGKGVYNFVNYAGNKLLAVSGGVGNLVNVNVKTSGNVGWKLIKHANGSFSLIPANSSKKFYLSVKDARAKSGENVRLYDHIACDGQRFFFTKNTPLTEAFKTGKPFKTGIVNLCLTGKSSIRVDVAGGSRAQRANVQTANASKAMSQKFHLVSYGNGLYELRNVKSGKALDVAGGSTKVGANVQQYSRNATTAQMWYFVKTRSGYQIRSAASGLALYVRGGKAVANANIQLQRPLNIMPEIFSVKQTQLIENGTYVLQSALAMPMVLDVKGGSTKSGANAQIYRSNGSTAQKFKIKHIGNGIYTIVSAKSGMYLDVKNASKEHGANVWFYKGNNSKAQQWKAEYTLNGIKFKSVVSGIYLDVSGARVKSGTNVQQWGDTGSNAQCWVLRDSNWSFYKNVSASNMKVIRKAEEYEGWPYQWGGRSPSTSFDCAGLVMYCSNKAWGTNFDLMYTNAEMLYYKCKPILASEAKPGDLVFYRGTYGSNVNYISHVVFYVGRGYMYGAGDPIGYAPVNCITNIKGKTAEALYARIYH